MDIQSGFEIGRCARSYVVRSDRRWMMMQNFQIIAKPTRLAEIDASTFKEK